MLQFSGENVLYMNLEHKHCLYIFALFKVQECIFRAFFVWQRGIFMPFTKNVVGHTVHIFLLSVWMSNKC